MSKSVLLKVPYYSQRDNKAQWHRTCNTSAHAMLLKYLVPNAIQGDDEYWKRFVEPYGDSTDHEVHTRALKHFGIVSEWRTNLDFKDIDRSLAAKIPMAIGVAHKGNITAPEGGHIILVIGAEYASVNTRNDDKFIVHDPWGCGFGYSSTNGQAVVYPVIPSLKNRWTVDGANTGWGRMVLSVGNRPTGLV